MKDASVYRKVGIAFGSGFILLSVLAAGEFAYTPIHLLKETVTARTTQNSSNLNSSSSSSNQSSNESSNLSESGSLAPLKFTADQFGEIQLAAKTVGVHPAYVPQVMNDENLKSVRIGDHSFSLEFSRLIINESKLPMPGGGVVTKEEELKVKDSVPAKWIELSNSSGSTHILSFCLDGTYIAISVPASQPVSSSEIVQIASSFDSLGSSISNSL